MSVAVYPGTFDPITNGHLDIIKRSLQVFDKLYIAIAQDNLKESLFSLQERKEMIETVLTDYGDRVVVEEFSGLAVEYVKSKKSKVLIRGLRALSDFEYEYQLSHMNKKLNEDIETVFLMTSVNYAFMSSSLIKQIISLGGELKGVIPSEIENKIYLKIKEKKHE